MPTATLAKWGNGQGILIPKTFCEAIGLKPGDKVDLSLGDQEITLKPEQNYTLEALMKGYDGPKPQEYDWGAPMGKEMW
ncbi:MAG: AbrB/MazE/SpoVT family DNA-binding domain-containing protein [Coriobacteriales bacterium]|jgi:AbrB family looped-hinge helix DNA binding protein|nr:AbrB/MazE/SpoVT family DNA-binding domain-containing protein [Coriobacteriales bacterium]